MFGDTDRFHPIKMFFEVYSGGLLKVLLLFRTTNYTVLSESCQDFGTSQRQVMMKCALRKRRTLVSSQGANANTRRS